MSANADTTMNESPRIASHCVFPQSYPVFAYRPLADADINIHESRLLRACDTPAIAPYEQSGLIALLVHTGQVV